MSTTIINNDDHSTNTVNNNNIIINITPWNDPNLGDRYKYITKKPLKKYLWQVPTYH